MAFWSAGIALVVPDFRPLSPSCPLKPFAGRWKGFFAVQRDRWCLDRINLRPASINAALRKDWGGGQAETHTSDEGGQVFPIDHWDISFGNKGPASAIIGAKKAISLRQSTFLKRLSLSYSPALSWRHESYIRMDRPHTAHPEQKDSDPSPVGSGEESGTDPCPDPTPSTAFSCFAFLFYIFRDSGERISG